MSAKKIRLFTLITAVIIIYFFVILKSNKVNKSLTLSLEINNSELFESSFEELNKNLSFSPSSEKKLSGNSSSYTSSDNVYNNLYTKENIDVNDLIKVRMKGDFYCIKPPKNLSFSIALSKENETYIWEVENLSNRLHEGKWQKIESVFFVDQSEIISKENITFKAFTYNNSEDEFYLDNYEIELMYK